MILNLFYKTGFVGVIPAMELMTKSDNPSGAVILDGRQLILWSLAIAFFGVFFAIPLRKETIIREKLKFPSGTATAQMISLLHQRPDPTIKKTVLRRRGEAQRLLSKPQPVYTPAATTIENEDAFEYNWTLKLRGLVASFTISSIYTVTTYFVPIINALTDFQLDDFQLDRLACVGMVFYTQF